MPPDIGVSILREIAAQHDRDGADERIIVDGIDFREKAGVAAGDLTWTLARLVEAGCIERRGER